MASVYSRRGRDGKDLTTPHYEFDPWTILWQGPRPPKPGGHTACKLSRSTGRNAPKNGELGGPRLHGCNPASDSVTESAIEEGARQRANDLSRAGNNPNERRV